MPGGTQTSTLVGLPDMPRVRRSRTIRRCILVLLFVFIALGLSQRLGVRSALATANGSGYKLNVVYAAVTRPGLDTPFTITVTHPGGFRKPVTLAVPAGYLDLFDKNGGLDPDPSSSRADGRDEYWTFDPPPGDTLRVELDAILAMGQQWGRDGHVRLVDGNRTVLDVSFHTWVMP